jgi:heme-degrading monooxygenase HmoA
MIVVVFEVRLKASEASRYFDLAAALRPELQAVPGFLSVERFKSLSEADKYVSLSFWESEAAVEDWRRREGHLLAQALGREEIFADFRITVARSLRSYAMEDRSPHPRAEPPAAFP